MDIREEQVEHKTVLIANGRLDAIGAPDLERIGQEQLAQNRLHIVVDMAGIDYISSAGLRSLLVLAKAVQAAKGTLALCALTDTVKQVMEISGFSRIFTLADDRETALKSV